MGMDTPEISGSVLAYSAIALLILTFVNNLLFGVFIKPYVDGDEPTPTVVRISPGGAQEQLAPLLSEKPWDVDLSARHQESKQLLW